MCSPETHPAPPNLEMSAENMAKYHLNENFDHTAYLNASDAMPTTGAKNNLTLADFRDAGYDAPKWEDQLDQLTVPEMLNMIALANGVDAMLATYGEGPNRPADYANPSASTVRYMRNACKNIMYTVVHSWMYDGRSQAAQGDGWNNVAYALDAAALAALAAVEVLIIRKSRKITADAR